MIIDTDTVLYPQLHLLMKEINNRIDEGLSTVIVAGQRSGKTEMLKQLCIGRRVFLYCMSTMELSAFREVWHDVHRGPTPVGARGLPEPDLVVIDEAFWTDDAFFMYFFWKERGVPVVAVGSQADEKEMRLWNEYITHRFATWELCPTITQSDLDRERVHNYASWFRDFASCKPEFGDEVHNTTVTGLIERLKALPQDGTWFATWRESGVNLADIEIYYHNFNRSKS